MQLTVRTSKPKQVVDITDEVQRLLTTVGTQAGLCNVFVLHTTAGITTGDYDPGTDLDYLDALAAIAPQLQFRHPHDPRHFPDHLLATMIGSEITVPFERGELALGVWQRILLFEFDGPRERTIQITFISRSE